MRVCYLLGGDEDGGLENHVITLCNEISKTENVFLIAHKRYRQHVNENITFINAPMTLGRNNLFLIFYIWLALYRIKVDIVHAHGSKATNILAKVKLILHVKTVSTIHGIKRKVDYYNKMDGVIGVSAAALQHVKTKKVVIYNGVFINKKDTKVDLYEKWEIEKGKKICMAIGRLVSIKGFEFLIESWVSIDANLVIIGDGVLRKKLENLIFTHKLTNRVKLVGEVIDAKDLVSSCDLVVIPSKSEGFSLVMAEALLNGIPVVSTAEGGPKEILPRKYLGEYGDTHFIERIVNYVLKNKVAVNKDFNDVFLFSENNFTIGSMIEKTRLFYFGLLE